MVYSMVKKANKMYNNIQYYTYNSKYNSQCPSTKVKHETNGRKDKLS